MPGSTELGELGAYSQGGLLVLRVPLQGGQRAERHFGDALERGPKPELSLDGTSRAARYRVRLWPGMPAGFPLGALGELGGEVG